MTLVTVNRAFQSKQLAYVLGQSKSVGLIAAPAYGITILSGGSGGGAGGLSRGSGFSAGADAQGVEARAETSRPLTLIEKVKGQTGK